MAFEIGAALAIVVFFFADLTGIGRERGFYPTVLIVIASYYALFAVMGGATHALLIETGLIAVFVAIALTGFRYVQWLTIVGLFAHGMFDWFHAALIDNPGVPQFWPPFCMAFDLLLGCCLALSLLRRPQDRRL